MDKLREFFLFLIFSLKAAILGWNHENHQYSESFTLLISDWSEIENSRCSAESLNPLNFNGAIIWIPRL